MKLTFTVDTDEMYGHDEDEGQYLKKDFQALLSDGLQKAIIQDAKSQVASEKFNEFSLLVSETIVADVKLRMQNFLNEEIVLTERWGEKTFIGSVEDLIKLRFDEVLLRPVDSNGKTLSGCTSSTQTWIEWSIAQRLDKDFQGHIKRASDNLSTKVKETVDNKLVELKDKAIKEQVDVAFVSILKK